MMLHVVTMSCQTLTSVKQTHPLPSPGASPYELMITMNYGCRVHMCMRSHVCLQHDTWILIFHYSSIMRPEMEIFNVVHNFPPFVIVVLARKVLIVVPEEDVFSFSTLQN